MNDTEELPDNWAEIPIPIGPHNPGLMLEWKRFTTATWTSYQQNQIDVIRKHAEISGFPATKITEVRKMIDPTTEHPG